MNMYDEQLEFSISQYADGTLPVEQVAALEARLAGDLAAREMLAGYRRVDSLLKVRAELPHVAWDEFSSRVSAVVAEEAELDRDRKLTLLIKSAPLPSIRWEKLADHLSRVIADAAEPLPIKLFPNRWARGFSAMAIAACLLLASALGIQSYLARQHRSTTPIVIGPKSAGPVIVATTPIEVRIGGPDMDVPQGVAIAEITIGAGAAGTPDDAPSFVEGIVAISPRSLIASNAPPVQDSAQMPY